LGGLGPTLTSFRAPATLAQVGAAQATAVQQLSIAIGEFADGLTADPGARAARLEHARDLAQRGEAESVSAAAHAAAAASGVAAGTVAAVPVVGPIIAATIATVAAIIVLMGDIAATSKEEESAAKKGRAVHSAGTKSHGIRWPP
jgi:hypothetical protein